MTAVNFANSPSNNDTQTVDGITYTYSSAKSAWVAGVPSGGGITIYANVAALPSGSSGDQALIPDVATVATSAVDTTNDKITITGHGFSDGDPVDYANGGGTSVAGLTSGTTYYVYGKTADTFQLVTTVSGTTAIDFTGTGNNAQTITHTEKSYLYIHNGSGWFKVALINSTPTWTTAPPSEIYLALDGTASVITIVATDPEGVPITYTATTSNLGSIATFVQGTGSNTNVWTVTPSTNLAHAGVFTATFRASDSINNRDGVTSFTLAFLSPYWKYVNLSTGTSTTDALHNSTFIDRSSNAHTITAVGSSPYQGTFNPYGTCWSTYFDGSSYLVHTDSLIPTSTGNAWTIDCWVWSYYTDGTNQQVIWAQNNNGNNRIGLYIDPTVSSSYAPKIRIHHSNGSSWGESSAVSLPDEEWVFLRVSCSTSNTMTLFINGTSSATLTFYGAQNTDFSIGESKAGNFGKFTGYISNLKYTSTDLTSTGTTVPDRDDGPFADAANQTLFCADNRHVSRSGATPTSSNTVSSGVPVIKKFTPFPDQEFGVGTNYGSVLLQGSVDGVTFASSSDFDFGTDDFCIEGWVYHTDLPQYNTIIDMRSTAWNSAQFVMWTRGSSYGREITGGSYSGGNTPGLDDFVHVGEWYHFSWNRIYDTSFTLYLNGELVTFDVNASRAGDIASLDFADSGTSYLGKRYSNTTESFYGHISDLIIKKGSGVCRTGSSFTLPTSPIGNTNAKLYLPFDNAGIFDKSGHSNFKAYGDAETSTSEKPSGFTSSIAFDGSGDYLIPKIPPILRGVADFTVEMWIYPNSAGAQILVDFRPSGTTGAYFNLSIQSDGTYNVWVNAWKFSGSGRGVTTGGWEHVAVVRSGTGSNNCKMYIDGSNVDTISLSTNFIATPANRPVIGASGYGTQYENFNGYLAGVQIVNTAKYTANFTPPSAPFSRELQ